jgi:fructose-1,6-bisphosphatase/inositol monophosphatase family enzyme
VIAETSLRSTVVALLKGAHEVAETFTAAHTEEVQDAHVTDISTLADRELSRYFATAVEASLPGAALWSEETGSTIKNGANYTVLVDEIDGTDNFYRGREFLPWCSVLTVFRGASPTFGDALAAGIVDHLSGRIWSAGKGEGLFEQRPAQAEVRLAAGSPGSLDRRSLVLVDHYSAAEKVARLTALNARTWVKDFGSSAFHGALLASGRVDAYVNLAHKAHELGAILLLAKEAGCALRVVDGSPLERELVDLEDTWPIVAARSECLCGQIALLIQS